jgi:hypothetical protein
MLCTDVFDDKIVFITSPHARTPAKKGEWRGRRIRQGQTFMNRTAERRTQMSAAVRPAPFEESWAQHGEPRQRSSIIRNS